MTGRAFRRERVVEETMRTKLAGERGMSLVEATIILMVLAVLTSVIAPSMGDYIEDARNTKAKEDVEVIGTAIQRLLRDTGLGCLSTLPQNAAPCSTANRADALISATGASPAIVSAAYTFPAGSMLANGGDAASVNWVGAAAVADAGGDFNVPVDSTATIDEQLITNFTNGYVNTTLFTGGGGPRAGLGWRGAYLTGPAGADPWGQIYQANTAFLAIASDATAGTGEGQLQGGWLRDVIVISAGSNGTIQTAFGVDGAAAVGDDVIYVVQGATR